MKMKAVFYLLNLLFLSSCVQGADKNLEIRHKHSAKQALDWVPFLTREGKYIYVDKNYKRQLDMPFSYATPFLSTGYAIVQDDERRNALIDANGAFIEGYTEDVIEVVELGNLTLVKVVKEYDKKMPIWKWEWNILGGSIRKQQTYHRVEIRVLETNQVLVSQDVPYREDDYSLNYVALKERYYVLNDVLYEIKNKRFKTIKKDILYTLDRGRYIPDGSKSISIYHVGTKKAVLSNLEGVTQLELAINNKPVLLDSINLDRYAPTVSKLLRNPENNDVYVYPQYDKVFPKVIRQATDEQLAFLNEVSLVYSVNNSPYFILGRFNSDHDVWAYDWLYVDQQGNLVAEIKVHDFFIRDQIGYLVWPNKELLFSKQMLEKAPKIGKMQYVYQSEGLYIVKTQLENKVVKEGIWNGITKEWELAPQYNSIHTLDHEGEIFALQKEPEGTYQLYDNKKKTVMGSNTYKNIYRNGMAEIQLENKEYVYFYVDVLTGKEYRAQSEEYGK